MNKHQSFTPVLDKDGELCSLKSRRHENQKNMVIAKARLGEIRNRLNANGIDSKALSEAIVSGTPVAELVPVAALREEESQVSVRLSAMELADKKFTQLIEARIIALSEAYTPTRTEEQRERARRIIDSLLVIAEANAEEIGFRDQMKADGCSINGVAPIEFPITSGKFGSYLGGEAAHIAALVDRYGQMIGYVAPANQHRRLEALGA